MCRLQPQQDKYVIPIIDLNGTAYARGRQQGEGLRQAYREMIDEFFRSDLWHDNKPVALPDGLLRGALGVVGTVLTRQAIWRHLPLQHQRIVGLGQGLDAGQLFIWGVHFLEIMFCAAGKSLRAPGGCTQVHVQPRAAEDGKPWMGRNYDFPNMLQPYHVVRREVPSEAGRLATTTVTQIPLAGAHQGVNEAGLAVAANNARLWPGRDLNRAGVPYMLILQEILETCRTAAEARDRITRFPARANAGFFGLLDETGECYVVEFTASRARVRTPDEHGVIAQTNHYHDLTEANLPRGTVWTVDGMKGLEYEYSTGSRWEAADRMLHELAGQLGLEPLKSILRDHSANGGVGSDATVCCHGATGSTLASMIIDVHERTLWIANGTPCTARYEQVPFRSR